MKKFLRHAVFGLLPTCLLLAAIEGAARVLRPAEHRNTNVPDIVESDPQLIWRLTKKSDGFLKTNELGLRDTPLNHAAETRILLLGDSVSWGDGIYEIEETFANILERRLNSDLAPATFEVINAGVPGYSTFQELRYLELYGLELKPNMIILQFCLNDVVERYQVLAEYGGDREFMGVDTRGGIAGLKGFLIRNLRSAELLVRWLQSKARRQQDFSVQQLVQNELSVEMMRAWELTTSEIESIFRLAAKHGVPILLLIAPYRFQIDAPEKTRQPQDRLLALAAKHGVQTVDLLPRFVEAHREGLDRLFLDQNHFLQNGHKITAESLYRAVVDLSK